MKNLIRITTALFICLFLLTIIPYNAGATSVPITFGFEGSVVGNDYDDTISGLRVTTTNKNASSVKCSSTLNRTGSRNLYSYDAGHGRAFWINLSYSKGLYLTGFSIWIDVSTVVSGCNFCFIFYNKTYQASKMSFAKGIDTTTIGKCSMMNYYFSHSGAVWASYVYDNLGTGQATSTQSHNSVYKQFYFTIDNSIGDLTVGNSTTHWHPTGSNSSAINNNLRIDRIWCYTAYGYTDGIHFDDMIITLSDSYASGGGTTYHDFSQYLTLGSYPTSYTQGQGKLVCTEHEEIYNQYFSGKIYGADIFNFNAFSDTWKTSWNLYINGFGYTPTSMYNITIAGINCQVFRYDFVTAPISISNSKILLEVYNPFKIIPALHTGDVDGDGLTEMKYGSAVGGNGVYDGSYVSPVIEFNYLLYYLGSSGAPPENTTTNNVLEIGGVNRGVSSTNSSKIFYQNDTVLFTWGLKDLTVSNVIKVKCNTAYINYSGFPKTLTTAKGSVGFRANRTGNYTVRLVSNSVISVTRYFYVTLNPTGNIYEISSSPPLTYDLSAYTVYYRYYNPAGFTGYLGVYTDMADMVTQLDIVNKSISPLRLINSNNSGNFLFIHNEKYSNHYWQLFSLVNGYFYPVGETHIHYIVDTLSYNYISTETAKTFINNPFRVFGTNTIVGGNVWICVNDYQWKDVSLTNQFSESYKSNKATTLIFSLKWFLANGTSIVLSIAPPVQITTNATGGGAAGGFSLSIPAPFSYFVGIFIILAFIIIPLAIARNFHFANSQITGFISVGTGVTGFILTILLGYFPAWSVAVFIIIMIVIIVIMWLQRKVGGV